MSITDFHKFHNKYGGKFTEKSDRHIPDFYSDVNTEVKAVRNSCGIIDLSDRGKLKLSGKEHLKLLQGMITNDVVKLGISKGLYATSLTPKGKMITDMRVHKFDDFAILDLEPGINETYGTHLLKYRLSYKADIEDITDSFSLFHLCGPGSTEIIKNNQRLSVVPRDEFDSVKVAEQGGDLLIIKTNRTGETGYDFYSDVDTGFKVWSNLLDNGADGSLIPFGLKTLDTLRIEAGIAVLGVDMNEDTIPIEAGLWSALDFEKGCYIGQEVIARIKWRGRVNWHLVGFDLKDFNDTLVSGTGIFVGDKKVGRITSSAFSPTMNSFIALGYIRREFKEEGLSVDIALGDNSVKKATVSELPFINNFN